MLIKILKALFFGKLKIHYGQWGEDVLVRKLFSRKKTDGFYLDIGAYHPFKHSNTAGFWLKGWTGINIDANPTTIKKFQKVRSKDINIWSAIVSEKDFKSGKKSIDLLLQDKNSISATGTCSTELAKNRSLSQKISVPTTTINNILTENNINHIDYMNIDVEGVDLEVIKNFDFNIVKPKVISIEDYSNSIPEVIESEISKTLFSNNYHFVARAGLTSIFML